MNKKPLKLNPITIGKNSTWSSHGGKYFWIGFCLVLMIGLPIFLWFQFTHQEFQESLGNIIGFEVFIGFLLLVFGILPKVEGKK